MLAYGSRIRMHEVVNENDLFFHGALVGCGVRVREFAKGQMYPWLFSLTPIPVFFFLFSFYEDENFTSCLIGCLYFFFFALFFPVWQVHVNFFAFPFQIGGFFSALEYM